MESTQDKEGCVHVHACGKFMQHGEHQNNTLRNLPESNFQRVIFHNILPILKNFNIDPLTLI